MQAMHSNKVTTVIAGLKEDSAFNYACYVAENLSDLLPNFSVKKVTKDSSDWQNWLENKCKVNGWCHTDSPLIWRKNGVCGGGCTYIGGNSEFKTFIQNYYGVEAALSKTEQEALDLDYLLAQSFESEDKSEESNSNLLRITISGAGRSVCPDLVAELGTMREISKNGIAISLYDTPGHYFKIHDIAKDAMAIGGELHSIRVLENLSEGLQHCDMLIILDHISREDGETTQVWLSRNYEAVKELAEQINIYAPTWMKVIFCSMGPTCFCANVMAKEAEKLDKNHIVAVSAHYGLEMVYEFVKSLNIDGKGIGCPPVWGYLGISQYVDIDYTIQKSFVHVPYKRALTSCTNAALPLGIKYAEFRYLFYLAFDKKPREILAKRKSMCSYHVGRSEDFQKCKAICDLLKLWYQKDDAKIEDEIISLGILSEGSFNIPKGVYFSQPVYLKILDDNSRVWVPCPEFPFPSDSPVILKNCAETAKLILENLDLID